MFRVQAIWTAVGLGTSYTNLHFTEGAGDQTGAEQAASRVSGFFGAISARINNGVTFTVNQEVQEVDPATGNVSGIFVVPPYTETGAESVIRVPDAAQVLLRLSTDDFRGARRIKGRCFIPGLATNETENGQVSAASMAGFQDAAETWLFDNGAGCNLVVWSRPTAPLIPNGVAAEVLSCSVWEELAMLTSRRS